jgi:hypothetical protein
VILSRHARRSLREKLTSVAGIDGL